MLQTVSNSGTNTQVTASALTSRQRVEIVGGFTVGAAALGALVGSAYNNVETALLGAAGAGVLAGGFSFAATALSDRGAP